jgi:hypothetical protein
MKNIFSSIGYFLFRLLLVVVVLMPMVLWSLLVQAWIRLLWFFCTPEADERNAVREKWGIPWAIIWYFFIDKPLD